VLTKAARTSLAAILFYTSIAASPGCVEKKTPGSSAFTMQSWRDDQPVIDVTKPATTRPAPIPEPKVIEDGDKATLIYSARFARPETLREAIEGLITPEGSAQASPSLNTLIVADRKDIVKSILAVLKEVDKPGQQLLVEARVVEVTIDSDLETELSHLLTSTGAGAFLQSGGITLKTPGATPTEGQGININIRPWSQDGKRIDDFIRVLLTRGKARILSSPNLVVSPGSTASIITGEEVPIQSTQVVAGSLSTTTQFKRVGIKLTVQLHQITADTARFEINPEVSTVTRFTPAGTGGLTNPVVAIRNVSSTISMKDGEILTVGGLLSDVDRSTIRGVPLLMDIPGLGILFQARRHQTVKTQLIFFMRIHILGDGIPRTTRVYRPGSTMEEIENRTGVVLPDALPSVENEKVGDKP
jgi:type II secretory pathway component GspD/PulD (secretin)